MGLAARHTERLSVADQAAMDPGGTRCRYAVELEPMRLCPNERMPGHVLCRPHAAQAVQLARRLGYDVIPPAPYR